MFDWAWAGMDMWVRGVINGKRWGEGEFMFVAHLCMSDVSSIVPEGIPFSRGGTYSVVAEIIC